MTRRIVVLTLGVLAAHAAWGQGVFVTRAVRTRPDFDYLYERVAASDFVVRGRLVDFKFVMKRTIPADIDRTHQAEKMVGGTLFTIEPGQTLCRQADFSAVQSVATSLHGALYLFVPPLVKERDPRNLSDFDRRRDSIDELMDARLGREYLLFLRKAPNQEDLVAKNYLDSGVTYYRTVEGDLGAVLLPDAANPERPYTFVTPLVTAVEKFCEAVRAPDAPTKIRNLNAIRDQSADPAWRQSVDAAIKAFQQQAQAKNAQQQ